MAYNYKGIDLPQHTDKQWHILVDPFFRWIIDNVNTNSESDPLDEYEVQSLRESGDFTFGIYTAPDNKWLVKCVEDDNNTYTTTWASNYNNAMDVTQAEANVETLTYVSNLYDIIS